MRKPRNKVTVTIPRWEKVEVPEAAMQLAEQRVQYLRYVALDYPLVYLLASAYLQGINDCVQTHINNPAAFPAA